MCTSADLLPCSLFKLNKIQLKLKVMSLEHLLLRQLPDNSSNMMSICHLTAQYSWKNHLVVVVNIILDQSSGLTDRLTLPSLQPCC